MAKKKRMTRTREEQARYDENTRMINARIAERLAREREQQRQQER